MNFLVIGVGSAGQRHLRVMRDFYGEQAKIFAYRGRHARGLIARDLLTENFEVDPIRHYGAIELKTLSELQTKSWDLVIIATPPDSHLKYTKLVAAFSRRIIIEKPLSVKVPDAEEMYLLAKSYNIPIRVGYQMMFHPLRKEILKSIPLIGIIESCSTIFNEDIALMNPFRSMNTHHLSSPEGGGVFLSLSHDLDLMLSIFDQTNVQRVSFTGNRYSDEGVLQECILHCVINANKTILNMTNKFSILPSATQRSGNIRGSMGHITWNLIDGSFQVSGASGEFISETSFQAKKDDLFQMQIEDILNVEHLTDTCSSNLDRAIFITKISQ